MTVHRVEASSQVVDDAGQVAIERGPIVYCIEGKDNGAQLMNFALADSAKLVAKYEPETLGGVVTISGNALVKASKTPEVQKMTAIPYYVWDNRGINEMKVWIPRK